MLSFQRKIFSTQTTWLVALVLLAATGEVTQAVGGNKEQPDANSTHALRAAVVDLVETFGDRYPDGKTYLAELDRLGHDLAGASEAERQQLRAEFESLRRRALVANPLVRGQPLLFIVRQQYASDHHNTATMFQTGEINTGSFRGGGAIKTIDFGHNGQVTPLYETADGVARDPDVRFDGSRILFSLRHHRDDDYHIYEMASDGSGLTQRTSGAGVSDIDPIYLPNGKILFSSTREPKYCMCNRHIMCNLFTINADGSDIEQIGHSTLHEGHSALLPDGRILYDRWEYVDRNFGDAQGVWSVNPDGTNHAIYWGNNTNSPGAVLDARPIPGSDLFLATFSSCHDRPWGALAIVDRQLGNDGRPPVKRTWPASAIDLVGVGNYDTFKRVQPKYEDPYPLSDKYFLCSRMTGRGGQMGIYLIDTFGNELLLHSEGPGCFDPMPLAPRTKPPTVPSRIDRDARDGTFYVTDVYTGTGLERIERGEVKYLRVVESPEKRFWTQTAWKGNGSGTQAPGMAWDDFNNKRILGTVPVEADGSAYFAVPADTFVYFQLLDERGMMLQSMRSGTIVRPGERAGCVGCHENRRVPAPDSSTLALGRAPSRLEPWYGPPRKFSYRAEVQPVFDRHCVSCHDFGNEAGKKLNLADDLGLIFNTSYCELRSKRYVRVPGAGPYTVLLPKSWGSHVSPLVRVLIDGHQDPRLDENLKLDRESFERIVTWIDINAPYYGDYASAYPGNLYGRSPLDDTQLKRLSQLTRIDLHQPGSASTVNFTRLEWSTCLTGLKDKSEERYAEALSIIRSGEQKLAERPRADMRGFQLTGIDLRREQKYAALVKNVPPPTKQEATALQQEPQSDR